MVTISAPGIFQVICRFPDMTVINQNSNLVNFIRYHDNRSNFYIFTPFKAITVTKAKSYIPAAQTRVPVEKSPEMLTLLPENWRQFFTSRTFYYGLVIAVVTFISFFPALKGGFMPTWDDEKYVTANPLVKEPTGEHVRQMFTRPVNGSYVPLPLLTFAIEYRLFGENPLPFHVTNLLLHILCTLLVFRILQMLGIDLVYAVFGALLFGIHPMRVESVAWITERKDVLYGVFYMASIIMYIRYVTGPVRNSRLLLYSILLFLGSLLSKIEAVTLPLTLLLIDFLLQRPFRVKLITEKIPYFVLSLIFGLAGILILYRVGLKLPEFLQADKMLSLSDRVFYALYAFSGYLVKFVVPYAQSAIYPYPVMTGFTMVWIRFINPVLLLALIFAVYRSAKKGRVIAFGMMFFLVNIFFLLQIFAVGITFFSDRYSYIPYFGLIFIVVWCAQSLVKKDERKRIVVLSVLSLLALVCVPVTFSRSHVWEDGVSLWSNVIDQYPGRSFEPYVNRGISYTLRQEWRPAIEDYTTALAIGPASAGVYADRGMVYGFTGQPEKAVADFSEAVRLDPKNAKALFNRGVTYGNMGQAGQAVADFKKVLEIEPENVTACTGLSIMLMSEMKFDSCALYAEKGIRLDPYRPELYTVLGNCQLEGGQTAKAIDNFRHCLRIDNGSLEAFLGLAAAFVMNGDFDQASRNLDFARQTAQQKNIPLGDIADIERAGISLPGKTKEALSNLLAHKR